jgi:hypothetical protein
MRDDNLACRHANRVPAGRPDGVMRFAYCAYGLEIHLGVFIKLAATYCFGRPGQRLLGLMIRVMSCMIAHEPGTSTPEFSSTTIVIRSDGRY